MTMGENLKSCLANMKANSDKQVEDLEKEQDEQTKSIANLTRKISTMEDMRAKQDERLMDLEKKQISDAEQADKLKLQILEVEDMFQEEILKHSNEMEEFQKKISSLRHVTTWTTRLSNMMKADTRILSPKSVLT